KGLQQLEDILEIDPLNGKALLTVANYKMSQSVFPEAEFYFERARSVDEFQVDALIGLARITVQQGRFVQALGYLKEAQNINPRDEIERYIASIESALSAQN
ncbi:MAG: tetratricopeptide (TPR) repeat protein, partial [Lentimonas sp.]